MLKERFLLALLAVAAVLSLSACAGEWSGFSSRENSTPSATETGPERGSNPRFPTGSFNTSPD